MAGNKGRARQGDFATWAATPQGQRALQWQLQQYDQTVSDVFGYHAVQLALPQGLPFPALQTSRIQHRYSLAAQAGSVACVPLASAKEHAAYDALCDVAALPLQSDSLDLLLCPHTLERSHDPHATLREVQRVLRPQGVVILSGLKLFSSWTLRQHIQSPLARICGRKPEFLPANSALLSWGRLRDWLRLLHLELCSVAFFAHTPLLWTAWPEQDAATGVATWLERSSARLWPSWGAVYFAVAIKRVHGMRLLEPQWSQSKGLRAAARPVRSQGHTLNSKK